MKKDSVVFISIYVLTLIYLIWYSVNNQVIVSDQLLEYQIYLAQIKAHAWNYGGLSVVNSCLLSTYIPAMLQLWSGWNAELLYKIFPNIFYALMFPFVYLIARLYVNRVYSVLTVAFVMANFFFAFYPTVGRVSIGWGIGTMVMYAILARKTWLAIPATAIMVISYYAITYIMLGLVIALVIYLLIRYRDKKHIVTPLATLATLVVGIAVWHVWIAQLPFHYARWFVGNTFDIATTMNVTPQPLVEIPISGITAVSAVSQNSDFWSLSAREGVVQVAFGKTLTLMNIPQKIEYILSWLTVGVLSIGILFMLLKRIMREEHELLVVASYVLIVATLIFPTISVYYGISRVYFTLLPIIGIGFTYGAITISKLIKVNSYAFQSAIILLFGLFVSGIGYRIFGIVK